MIERLKQGLRPKAKQKIDHLVGDLYVREEALESTLDAAVEELRRILFDRFDAEAEVNAIIGQRLAGLVTAVEMLHDEVRALRSEIAVSGSPTIDDRSGDDRGERTWSRGV